MSSALLFVISLDTPPLLWSGGGAHPQVVYAYKGALLGSLVVYILPAVMYIALLPPSTRRLRTLAAPVLLALFGALSLVLGTYGAILHTRGGLPSEGTVTNKLL